MKTVRKKSQEQEKRTAKQFGGKTVIASGALWARKADVREDKYLIECKTTEKDFYSVTSRVWEKIEKEAVNDSLRTPVLQVDIKGGTESYVVITRLFLRSLVEPFDYEEYFSYATVNKSFRLNSIGKDEYVVFYSIARQNVLPNKRENQLAVLRLDDFLELIKEDTTSGT